MNVLLKRDADGESAAKDVCVNGLPRTELKWLGGLPIRYPCAAYHVVCVMRKSVSALFEFGWHRENVFVPSILKDGYSVFYFPKQFFNTFNKG